MEQKVLSVKDLQRTMGIGRNAAYELVNRADFPAVRIGKTIRIPAKDFEEWLSESARKAAQN